MMPDTAAEHNEFYAPEVEISVDGTVIDRNRLYISRLEVDLSCEAASLFSMRVANAIDDTLEISEGFPFTVGSRITIRAGYESDLENLFEGVITAVTAHYGESEHLSIDVEGCDLLFLLMKQYHHRAFEKTTDSDIAKELINVYDLQSDIDDSGVAYDYTRQDHESDFSFLNRLARRSGFEFYAREGCICFKAPAVNASVSQTLTYGKDPVTFSCRHDIAGQMSQVEIYGWDKLNNTGITEKTAIGDVPSIDAEKSDASGALKRLKLKEKSTYTKAENYADIASAKRAADALMHRFAYSLVSGRGSTAGIPSLRPAQVIEMAAFSTPFNGRYYLSRVIHRIGKEDGYSTDFEVKGNRINATL
jgi:phage protein D